MTRPWDHPDWHGLLRALVDQAWAKRGTAAFDAACADIVDTHRRWPLVTLARELEAAERLEAELAELDWYERVLTAASRERYARTPEETAALVAGALDALRESFRPSRVAA